MLMVYEIWQLMSHVGEKILTYADCDETMSGGSKTGYNCIYMVMKGVTMGDINPNNSVRLRYRLSKLVADDNQSFFLICQKNRMSEE